MIDKTKKTAWYMVASLYCILGIANTQIVHAISTNDLNSINNNTAFFDPNDTTSSCGGDASAGGGAVSPGTDTAKWQTTLQPPYSLEDFVVELLRDVAAKEGVPESDTVTQQHVLALVAFAYGEGGNLTNNDIYNPWNTGYSGADLQPVGGHSTSGVQSYGSFNDGVEATARVMTGTGGSNGYQTRIGATLKDPSTTAQQFMKALTYFQNYQGNKAWAGDSDPTDGVPSTRDGSTGAAKQAGYYQWELSHITAVQSSYKSIASLVIGPPGNSANNNQQSPHSLRYSFSSDTSGTSGSGNDTSSCASAGGGVVGGNIVATAIGLAWSDVTYPYHGSQDTPSCTSSDPANNPATCHHGFQESADNPGSTNTNPKQYTRQTYQDAWAKYNNADSSSFTDCGVYVATVLRASGVATDYPTSGSGTQRQWAIDHPDKYMVKENPTVADLQPGDILVNSDHTFIYVGHVAGTQFTVAEASQFNHSPELDNIVSNEINGFTLVRVKS